MAIFQETAKRVFLPHLEGLGTFMLCVIIFLALIMGVVMLLHSN